MSSSVKAEVRSYRNYVNGQWAASASGETFPVHDPSTEEVIARVSAADRADVDVAVKAAREAFDSGPWSKTTAQDRGRILMSTLVGEQMNPKQPIHIIISVDGNERGEKSVALIATQTPVGLTDPVTVQVFAHAERESGQ